MIKYLILAMFLLTFISCEKTAQEKTDTWKLIEFYGDPGDGSGDFIPVDSDKTITFFDDGKIEVKNGSLCDLDVETGEVEGTYEEDTMLIFVECTELHQYRHRYEIDDVGNLLLYYPCIEPCVEKYEK